MSYEAPTITSHGDLKGHLSIGSGLKESDAQIKHGTDPVKGYEAPTITDTTPLDGALRPLKSEF